MFIVQSSEKTPTIRSALGFMSLTSRWGGVLFPGITVLTRDFYAIKAMHDRWINFRGHNKTIREFKSRLSDFDIANRVVKLKGAGNCKDYIQIMTYWQRYGSLFEYFRMFDTIKTIPLSQHRLLVFGPNYKYGEGYDRPWEKDLSKGALRMKHAAWYRRYRNKISDGITLENLSTKLKDPFCYWWITGLKPPSRVPILIAAVRRIEFALIVWQTVFEAASLLFRVKETIPINPGTHRDPLKVFIESVLRFKAEPKDRCALKNIVEAGLALHKRIIETSITSHWREKVYDEVVRIHGKRYSKDALFSCHNGTSLVNIAGLPTGDLLSVLAKIHVFYCEYQRKPNSIYMKSFFPHILGTKVGYTLSVEFSGSRWGLFGYRLNASNELYTSIPEVD